MMNYIDDFLFCCKSDQAEELQKFVDGIMKILGWSLSLKNNQLGNKVKFLGFVIDSVEKKFRIPQSTCEKAKKMIDLVCQKSLLGQKLEVKDLQKLTGKLVSLRLAIPSILVWIREVYFCLPPEEEGGSETRVDLSPQGVESLTIVRKILEEVPTSPFVTPVEDVDVYVDSSEVGWGASLNGAEHWGTFESNDIGKSSTFRELKGMWEVLSRSTVIDAIREKTVRFNMDSTSAVANLVHSGPVRELSPLVQNIWKVFRTEKIRPVFRWVRRETSGLSRVDELSKKVSFELKNESRVEFERVFQCPILSTDHNKVSEVLSYIVFHHLSCGVLIPRWEGKSWWTLLVNRVSRLYPISREHIVFRGGCLPAWEFVLALFYP
jgi:hypothetical protein